MYHYMYEAYVLQCLGTTHSGAQHMLHTPGVCWTISERRLVSEKLGLRKGDTLHASHPIGERTPTLGNQGLHTSDRVTGHSFFPRDT